MLKKYLYSTSLFSVVLTVLSGFVWINEPYAATSESTPITGEITASTVADTPNLTTINEQIFFSGQPTATGILAFREKGVKTIINLRSEAEMQALDFKEAQLAESLGIQYLNFPIGRDELSDSDVEELMSMIDENSDEPLLLHCGTSVRVGYAWALYQGSRSGLDTDSALEQGRKAGMSSPVYEERASNYLNKR